MLKRLDAQVVLFNYEKMNETFKKNLRLTIIVVFLFCTLLLITIEDAWHNIQVLKDFLKEVIIVVGAAIIVSLYFEYNLRKEISDEFNKILEAKEEFGKAGILKYYSNFRDINIRSFFKRPDVNSIDIYVTFAHTVLNQVQDNIGAYVKKDKTELNIYLFSPKNKFISGLGNLWGSSNDEYNEEGIKTKIQQSLSILDNTFRELETQNLIKAKINIYLLLRNPVFYSFYRFNDEMIYVPSKIVESKSFASPSFIVKKTTDSEGIFNKCMAELKLIKEDRDALELYFTNTKT